MFLLSLAAIVALTNKSSLLSVNRLLVEGARVCLYAAILLFCSIALTVLLRGK
jgi:hypothetical protein